MLAVDHGYFLGPTSGLEFPSKTLTPLLPYSDAIMLTRGVLRNCVSSAISNAIVLRVSGGTSIVGESLSNEAITTSIEDAIRLNASAIALSVFVGSPHEQQTLGNLAKLIDLGEEYGMPVLAVTAVGRELTKRDAKYLALSARISAEMGAHLVKTYYCEDFRRVVEGCMVPVVVAGGPKLGHEIDALELASNAIQEGAAGVDMGRNIWQDRHPVAMIRAVRAIVHEGASPKEAYQVYVGQGGKKAEQRVAARAGTLKKP